MGRTGSARRPQRCGRRAEMGQPAARAGSQHHEIRRQLCGSADQRAPGQLAVDQSRGLRQGGRHAADHPRGIVCRCRQAESGRLHCPGPWRPALAGRHGVRRPGLQHPRCRWLPQSLRRAGQGDPDRRQDGRRVRRPAKAAGLYRCRRRRARLEYRCRPGDQWQGWHAGNGRLGQERVDRRRQGRRQGLPVPAVPR
ncbi:hypothetical protein FQZ97_894260 [compost metagenome]